MDNYFQPAVHRSDAVTAASADLTEEIEGEGIVLLKNDNDVLPLAANNRRVNVFGWSSTSPVYGGTGSGAVDADAAVDLLAGLEAAGIEYNTQITDFYTEFRTGRPTIAIRAQDWTVPEPTIAEYDAAGIFESATEFSDTAVVMLSRSGGEGADLARSLGGSADDISSQELPDGRVVDVGSIGSAYEDDIDATKHYLELSNREHAMLERVAEEFENVVVLLNTGNVFELGWVDELDVDAVAWIGGPGETGFVAVGDMLTGQINPSGRTVDTWLYDLFDSPSSANFGRFSFTGSEDADSGDVPIAYSGDPATSPGYQFVDYAEGIYVGYRFFETYFMDNEVGYRDVVQYPFGYGLSYTEFEQTLDGLSVSGDSVVAEVTVTNVGDTAGKDVVQLYDTPPYTNGGIEKSYVNLLAFDKTDMLEPGASQTMTLSVPVEDLASFDYETEGAYVLEAGRYEFKLMADSHDVIDSRDYIVSDAIVYGADNPRATDEVAATTQFADAEGEVVSLSRADSFANLDEALEPASDREMTAAEETAVRVELPTDPGAEMPVTGADNGLSLEDVVGLDYDDPAWDQLLDQLTIDEMTNLIAFGGYQTEPVDSVGKPSTIDIDGPQGLSSFMGASVRAGAYPTAMVIASTWNADLARERGQMVGYEALEMGVNGWYAPGMNIHRSPFGGRDFEYYSEDPVLSGSIASAEVAGAQGEGLYVYIKHFVLNEQETFRNSRLTTWINEQALREIYLKPFEDSVKDGGATALMSSFNYIGGVWAGGSDALLNTVLRDEWGFNGVVVTDYFGNYGYMSANQAIANGGDLMLSTLGMYGATPEVAESDALGVLQLRTASKNIMYTVANSNAMYTAAERNERLADIGGHVSELSGFHRAAYNMGVESWELAAYLINGAVAVLLLLLVGFKIRKYRQLFAHSPATVTQDREEPMPPAVP
ncbi:glycoside hydrolase family 3 protein [Brooklawnia cerclae]|uniref:Beta-glucosidase n=1 Tax=Brooklawnia cerclae TaxID=349934 RepID=A0ABX0SIA9_9ACTN|nr:glycoside hydrolase family 3 protein [Brooklawnia cerclae]NIH57706.1 beta-glucosidase [Brooklawnia cerclae]